MRLRGFLVAAAMSLSAFAGSTGTTALHTPQGSASSLPFGDFVSDDDPGGLNTFYRYFIEVPPGITRLQVEIFDADIGISATEDTAGRDRDRGAYDTTVTYSLRDPAGTVVPVRFTTGDDTQPTGADNAWLTFYNATGNFVADNFGTAAFTNNDGNANWAGNWIETDGGGAGAGAGAVRVTGGELRIQDGVAGTPAIQREADLLGTPGLNMGAAYFSFDYRTSNDLEDADQLSVQVSGNGGGSWTTLETFSNDSSGSRTYDVTAFIANNTRIRFLTNGGLTGTEFFFFDNVRIHDGEKTAGHWELRVDLTGGGDDINAIGIRAHDGDATSTGTELNVYADSMWAPGVNPPGSGTQSRGYTLHPYITSGCTCGTNDFDFDSNSGNIGSQTFSSRTTSFSQTFNSAVLSGNNVWNRDAMSGWTSDGRAMDYGIWTLSHSFNSYLVGGTPNGNYGTMYISNFATAANPPAANPLANTFRVYLPTDAGTAPPKPYLEQEVTHNRNLLGANPPLVGNTSTFTVTVRLENPTPHDVTFSASNLVTTNVPGGAAVYGGNAMLGQGTIVSQPAVGGSGNITWNPGVLAAGDTAILSYDVRVTPVSAGQRIPVTATPGSGNGTRAQFVDETGNTTQARATFTLGPLCELAVTEGLLTEVLLSSFRAERGSVEWTTASEAGTIGFNLYRADGTQVNESLIPANRAGRYRLHDSAQADAYILEEITARGKANRHGPLSRLEPLSKPRDPLPVQALTVREAATPQTNAVKPAALMLSVNATGIVRVAAADIARHLGRPAGSVESAIRRGDVSVTFAGAPIAWTAAGDAVVFFGEASQSIYASERVYRLELARGTTMKTVRVAPVLAPVSTFMATHDIERDAFPATVLPLDPEGDYWFWDFVISGDAGYGRTTFAIDAPSLASQSDASLQIRLQGALAGLAHAARVTLNGVPLGTLAWESLDAHTATLPIPGGILAATNEVAIEGVLAAGDAFDVFYVDGFTLRYERFASGGIEISREGTIAADGFANEPVALDVTHRRKPALLGGVAFANGVASFVAPPATRSVFLADTFLTPSMRATGQRALDRVRADYVIVAPAALRAPAEALARLRRREGLSTFVADLEQIYDEFSGGNPTPHAIRAFLARARPRYAVLAGTGTYDYRGLDVGPGLVPPLMTKTADGLFAADTLFAPGTAIGRIPVSTAAELQAYVDKLTANERDAAAPLVFSSDAVDRAADFRRTSILAAAPLMSRPALRIDLDDMPPPAARTALLEAWASGTPLVSWTGHGGLDQLATSGILTAADAPSLQSTGPLPLVVAMTCTINRFEDGIVEPLGSALTRAPNAGALAVWSASGLSAHGEASELQRTFLRLAAESPKARVGDLIVRTLTAHPSATAGIYLLLGDPALSLSLPSELSNAGPGSSPGE